MPFFSESKNYETFITSFLPTYLLNEWVNFGTLFSILGVALTDPMFNGEIYCADGQLLSCNCSFLALDSVLKVELKEFL